MGHVESLYAPRAHATSVTTHLDGADARDGLKLGEFERTHARTEPSLRQRLELLLRVRLEWRVFADRGTVLLSIHFCPERQRRSGIVHRVESETQDHQEEREPERVDFALASLVAHRVEMFDFESERRRVEVMKQPRDVGKVPFDEKDGRFPAGQGPHDPFEFVVLGADDRLGRGVKVEQEVRPERSRRDRRGGHDRSQGFRQFGRGRAETRDGAAVSWTGGDQCRVGGAERGSLRDQAACRPAGPFERAVPKHAVLDPQGRVLGLRYDERASVKQ